ISSPRSAATNGAASPCFSMRIVADRSASVGEAADALETLISLELSVMLISRIYCRVHTSAVSRERTYLCPVLDRRIDLDQCGITAHRLWMASKARAGLREEFDLLGRRGAAEHRVAMGETAEPLDDAHVAHREIDPIRFRRVIRQRRMQRHASALVLDVLAMLERQIGEQQLAARVRLVVAAVERVMRQRQRARIGGEGLRIAAEHVPRELVAHNDQREAAARVIGPVRMRAGAGLLPQRTEARDNLGVERRVLLEPRLARLAVAGRAGSAKPEFEDFAGPVYVEHLILRS